MYEVLNEITGDIIKTYTELDEAVEFATKEWSSKKRQTILVKESGSDNILREFRLLLD